MEEILETACPSTEGSQQEGAVGDTLGPRSSHSNGVVSRDTGNDLASLGERLGDDGVSDPGGLLLVRGADPRKNDNLLDRTAVLLVDLHNIEESVDRDKLGGGDARDSGVVDGHGKVVRLETPSEATNAYLPQHAHLAGNLRFQYHSDTDAFSVENGGGQNCLDSVADGMAEVD